MAIKKQFLKSKPVCKVTFSFNEKTADSVSVVGSFNNWDTEHTVLKKLKNGSFKGTLIYLQKLIMSIVILLMVLI